MLLFGLFTGLSEEISIRGYLLSIFTKKGKNCVGIIWTSVLFSAMHILNPEIDSISLINIFLVGFFLALITIYTKTLFFPIIFHASFNFFDTLLGFNYLLTDIDYTWLIVKSLKSNDLLTGGKGGMTGSIILTGLLMLSIAFIAIIFILKKKKKKSMYRQMLETDGMLK